MPRKKAINSNAKKTASKRGKSAKKATKKTTKLDNLSQAHGKDESVKYQARTLDQVWGDDGMWRYTTLDEGEYKQNLKEMTRSDMYAHASKVGIIPGENLEQLKNRLLKEFRRHVSLYRVPVDQGKDSQKVPLKVRKILEEGK